VQEPEVIHFGGKYDILSREGMFLTFKSKANVPSQDAIIKASQIGRSLGYIIHMLMAEIKAIL